VYLGRGKYLDHTTANIAENSLLRTFQPSAGAIVNAKDTLMLRFTLNRFDSQERNTTFVKPDFQVSKLNFHACNFKQASFLFINYKSFDLDNTKNTFI